MTMRGKTLISAALLGCVLLSLPALHGCDLATAIGAGIRTSARLLPMAAVSETKLQAAASQMRNQQDRQARVAPPGSRYDKRLRQVMGRYATVEKDGKIIPVNYKVYITSEVNANATPDGSVRVYSGLMDLMTDDELRFVLGHEIGHVALGHALNRMRMSCVTAAAREAVSAAGGIAATLSQGEIGSLAEKFLNAQYDQSQELDADAYGVKKLKEFGYPAMAAVTALGKLKGAGGFFSTHPSSAERVAQARKLVDTPLSEIKTGTSRPKNSKAGDDGVERGFR